MLNQVKIFSNSSYDDNRGSYWTVWEKKRFKKLDFNHDKFSYSKKNVFRGLHGDKKSYKLVSCVYGKVFFVIVDYNKKSKTYLKHLQFILSKDNKSQILIPPNFLNGYYCMSKDCLFHYKWSYRGKYPDVKDQFSLNWRSKDLNIKWPFKNPITSNRDK